jgi:uncharacterized protein (TIGR00730 family)
MPAKISSVVVFCGSRVGNDPAWRIAAEALGRGLASAGIRLIYGGGRTGLMGAIADGALAAGGTVTGIIPDFLRAREVAHAGVTDLLVTDSMHSRKALMFEHADAFVTMPGGLGTLDETAEIITWRQLGLHDRPILIVNINGWAAPLIATLNAYIADGFADPTSRALYEVLPDTSAVLRRLLTLPAQTRTPTARL